MDILDDMRVSKLSAKVTHTQKKNTPIKNPSSVGFLVQLVSAL